MAAFLSLLKVDKWVGCTEGKSALKRASSEVEFSESGKKKEKTRSVPSIGSSKYLKQRFFFKP